MTFVASSQYCQPSWKNEKKCASLLTGCPAQGLPGVLNKGPSQHMSATAVLIRFTWGPEQGPLATHGCACMFVTTCSHTHIPHNNPSRFRRGSKRALGRFFQGVQRQERVRARRQAQLDQMIINGPAKVVVRWIMGKAGWMMLPPTPHMSATAVLHKVYLGSCRRAS
jgi:hypothetical protein